MSQEAAWSGPATGNYRWFVMSLWQVGMVSGWMVVATLGILLPSISSDLGLSPRQQGLLGSAAVWGNLGLALPLGWWLSRYSPKWVLVASQMLATAFVAVQGWAPGYAFLLLGRLGLGLSVIMRGPAQALLIQQWFPRRQIPLVNGFSNATFNLVMAAGLLTTPFILGSFGNDWRRTFHIFVLYFIVLTVLWVIFGKDRSSPESRRQEESRESGVIRAALSRRDLWLAGLAFCGTTMAEGAFFSFFPTMMLNVHGVSLKWSGALTSVYLVVAALSGFVIIHLAARLGKGKQILQAMSLLLAGTFMGLTMTGSIPVLVILALLNGVAWGFWPLITTVPYLLPGARPREVAIGVSFIQLAISSGTAVGPLVTGFLQEALGDLRLALWIMGFAPLSLAVAGTFLRPDTVGQQMGRPPGLRSTSGPEAVS